jgi:mono/diheme cytochrome c family protein
MRAALLASVSRNLQTFWIALVALGCASSSNDAPPPPASAPIVPMARPSPPVPRFQSPTLGQFHMRLHASDLRQLERHLLAGRLTDAASFARSLIGRIEDPGLVRWQDGARRVAVEAVEVIYAPDVETALRQAPRIAAACAQCHAASLGRPIFEAAPPAPVDDHALRARMARHVWATDRLWEGIIGPADDRWTQGLQVLADTPLTFSPRSDAPLLATQLQRQARAQLATPAIGVDARAAAYGELLVTCGACHASTQTAPR